MARSLAQHIVTRLYFCVDFLAVVLFRNLLYIQTSTYATEDHKYSSFPSLIWPVPEFWFTIYHIHFLAKSGF